MNVFKLYQLCKENTFVKSICMSYNLLVDMYVMVLLLFQSKTAAAVEIRVSMTGFFFL